MSSQIASGTVGAADETAPQTDAACFIQTYLCKRVLWYFLPTCENLIYLPFMLQVAPLFFQSLCCSAAACWDVLPVSVFCKREHPAASSINSSLNKLILFLLDFFVFLQISGNFLKEILCSSVCVAMKNWLCFPRSCQSSHF